MSHDVPSSAKQSGCLSDLVRPDPRSDPEEQSVVLEDEVVSELRREVFI